MGFVVNSELRKYTRETLLVGTTISSGCGMRTERDWSGELDLIEGEHPLFDVPSHYLESLRQAYFLRPVKKEK